MKKAAYFWKGINARGVCLEGLLEASNKAIAKNMLLSRGIIANKIARQRGFLARRVKNTDIIFIFQKLAYLLDVNVPLLQALQTLIEITTRHRALQQLLEKIKTDVAAGISLSQAVRKHPRYFSTLTCELMAAGERSASLAAVISQIAVYQEKMAKIKARLQKALIYPAVVLIMASIVIIGLLLFVVPQFESLFESFGASLPLPTRMVITIMRCLQNNGIFILISGFLLSLMLCLFVKFSTSAKKLLAKLSLSLPFFGRLYREVITARITRTLAMTYSAGVPLVDALCISVSVALHPHYRQAMRKVSEAVIRGETLADGLRTTGYFSPLVVQMVTIGEQSGALLKMLQRVAENYETQIDEKVAILGSLLEPAIMIFLGFLIGGLVIAMYLPVFQLGKVV